MKKFSITLTEHAINKIYFENNFIDNKRRTKTTSRCKSVLHLRKKES